MKQYLACVGAFRDGPGAGDRRGYARPPKPPAKPAASKVDPALEAAHTKEDVRRHRIIAAAHEAAAKCQESGKDEDLCDAELAEGVHRASPTASTAA